MAKYNEGHVYNASTDENGFFYNGLTYAKILQLRENVNLADSLPRTTAKLLIVEYQKIKDALLFNALFKFNDEFEFSDKSTVDVLFDIIEPLNIDETFSQLLALAFLNDKFNIFDQVKQLALFIKNEELSIEDIPNLSTFFSLLDEQKLDDLSHSLNISLAIHEILGATDKEPKKAISDFLVGAIENLDQAYDWLVPLYLKIDWASTEIQVMPETETTTIEMPGTDGSIVEDTTYKNRMFQLVGFSEQGLTKQQKEDLKADITEVLNATKNQTKKLTIQSRGTSFDVKYDGQANITEGPSYVKATIPFRASPYGYETFEHELEGRGLIDNYGVADMGTVHKIKGPIQNPTFVLGDKTFTWNGAVPEDKTLVINNGMLTCYLVDALGNKTNARADLEGDFYKIPAGQSVVLNADDNTAENMVTTWAIRLLW